MPKSSKLGLVGVVVFLAATIMACGKSGGGPDGGIGGATGGASGGAGSTGTAGAGTAGAGGLPACSAVNEPGSGATCNVIAAGGPCVSGTFSTAAPPTPGGGAFVAGTYNLVSETFYGSADDQMNFQPGVPFRQTYALSQVTSTSFTLDQVWATGTYVARFHE